MQSLVERQAALAAYLADPSVFRGRIPATLLGPDRNIDPARLRLVGDIAYRKRTDKIRRAFPLTIRYLGDRFHALMLDFAHACPPTALQLIVHAEQFRAFLSASIRMGLVLPAFIEDLADLELAMVRVNEPEEGIPYLNRTVRIADRIVTIVSRHEALRLSYDIRALFDRSVEREIAARAGYLAVVNPQGQDALRIGEVTPEVYQVLSVLKEREQVVLDGRCDGDFVLDALHELQIVRLSP